MYLLIAYISGFVGSLLIWFFGLPRRDLNKEGTSNLLLEQVDEDKKKKFKFYTLMSNTGILLISVSFLIQILIILCK